MQYINKRGNPVEITVSKHARKRFIERWKRLYPSQHLSDSEVDIKIEECFNNTDRVQNFDKHEKRRLKNYGQDTLFFRTSGFTFIVQNSMIITIEISDDGMRELNNKRTILYYANIG